MHLFDTKDFKDYSDRIYLSIKKNLEATVELQVQRMKDEVESQEEDLYKVHTQAGDLAFYYDGVQTPLPNVLLDIDILELLRFAYEDFNEGEKQSLLQYLPERNQQIIEDMLRGDIFNFGNPIKQFDTNLKRGCFSKLKEKQQELEEILAERHLLEYYKKLLAEIKHKRKQRRHHPRRRKARELSQVSSLSQLIESDDFDQASEQTYTQEMADVENEKEEVQMTRVFFKYQDRRKTQEQLIAMGDDRGGQYRTTKIVKPMLVQTKIVRSHDWVEIYRKQQQDRYKVPTKPYTYTCQDGTKVTVAPVSKKMVVGVGKPREHVMLRNERPSCVTILTLVRDAAARLPGGVGTRADICELLKESQYVNEDIGDDKINTIVSGALDRLHYMTDACVKYDSEKKLWQYLHLERTPIINDEEEEYKEKKQYKKKTNKAESVEDI